MRPFASLILAVAALAPAETPGRITDAASYEVYGAALKLDAWARRASTVFLRGSTRFDKECLTSPDAVPGDWNGVLSDYLRKNRESSELDASAKLAVPVQTLGTLWVDDIISKPGEWEFFWHEPTNALDVPIGPDDEVLFQVSAVGFDKAQRRAIVYLAHHAGGDSGAGTVWLLERQADGWVPFTTFEQCKWAAG